MIALRICTVLLPLLAFVPAQGVGTPAPDAELQGALRRLAEDSAPDELRATLRFLDEKAGVAHARLVPQLLLFKEASRSTREGMVFGAVVEQLRIPEADVVAGLVPLFEGADAARRASLGGVLSEYEDRSIDRGADFDGYRPFLGGELPVGLVRYLYETDADAALLTLTRSRALERAELRELVLAQHEVADLRWRLRFGYLSRADLPRGASPESREALGMLAAHGEWWVRLAAASMALDEPGLRALVPLDALADDPHALVREVARAARGDGR